MFKRLAHKTYFVGGCVRDEVMGKEPKDFDFVVEATEETFRTVFPCETEVPKVGDNFPVFLVEGNEVALTRTERCTGDNYQDFVCDEVGVELVKDLGRRDFTCNSMAKNFVTGELVDPFNGVEDVKNRVLRCVNPAAFSDDPLRVLRAARFASRFGFIVEEKTMKQMQENSHRLVNVTKERVELELRKMFEQAEKPSVFFEVLAETGGLVHVFPELDALRFVTAGPNEFHHGNTAFEHTMEAVNRSKRKGYPFEVFVAVLFHDLGKGTTPKDILPHHYGHEDRSYDLVKKVLAENRFSYKTNKLALTVAKNHMRTHLVEKMKEVKLVRFFKAVGPTLWFDFLRACDCDHPLTLKKKMLLRDIRNGVLTAKVEVPKETLAKGKEAVVSFVENVQVKNLKRVFKEG